MSATDGVPFSLFRELGTGRNSVENANGMLTQAEPSPMPLSGQLGTFREVSQEDASRCHTVG